MFINFDAEFYSLSLPLLSKHSGLIERFTLSRTHAVDYFVIPIGLWRDHINDDAIHSASNFTSTDEKFKFILVLKIF